MEAQGGGKKEPKIKTPNGHTLCLSLSLSHTRKRTATEQVTEGFRRWWTSGILATADALLLLDLPSHLFTASHSNPPTPTRILFLLFFHFLLLLDRKKNIRQQQQQSVGCFLHPFCRSTFPPTRRTIYLSSSWCFHHRPTPSFLSLG